MTNSLERILHVSASLATLVAFFAGGAIGDKAKGADWGTLAAASVGAICGLFLVASLYAILYVTLLCFRRPCPHCRGSGWAADENIGGHILTHKTCTVCGGGGKIW